MAGGEYLRLATLEALWTDLDAALRSELRETSLEQWLEDRHAAWNVVGRVYFHLAENKADEERPFAFLATYTTRLSGRAQPQHRPLGQALRDFAADKRALLSLLAPVQRATRESALAKELVDRGEIYRALAWTPDEAHRFLREVPAFEEAGIVVRVPDWWKKRSRVGVDVKLGGSKPAGLGPRTRCSTSRRRDARRRAAHRRRSWHALAAHGPASRWCAAAGWRSIASKLRAVLDHWKNAQTRARQAACPSSRACGSWPARTRLRPHAPGATCARLVAGAAPVPGSRETLRALREPEAGDIAPGPRRCAPSLRPYQQVGVRWLSFALWPRPRRLPGRRHGARQDHPGAGAAAPGARRSATGSTAVARACWSCRPR